MIDWARVFIVALILITAIVVNVVVNVRFNDISGIFPFIGAAVWVALLVCVPLRRPAWSELPGALRGSIFLLSLVLAASMMPVHKLPDASWQRGAGARIRVGGVRQHSADRAGAASRAATTGAILPTRSASAAR